MPNRHPCTQPRTLYSASYNPPPRVMLNLFQHPCVRQSREAVMPNSFRHPSTRWLCRPHHAEPTQSRSLQPATARHAELVSASLRPTVTRGRHAELISASLQPAPARHAELVSASQTPPALPHSSCRTRFSIPAPIALPSPSCRIHFSIPDPARRPEAGSNRRENASGREKSVPLHLLFG